MRYHNDIFNTLQSRFYLSCGVQVSVMSFRWNAVLYLIILTVFDAVRMVEPSPEEVEPSPDEVKSHHWSKMVCPLLTCISMIAAHLRRIMKVETVLIVIINFMQHILEQCPLVTLIVMCARMRHSCFQICSHIHPTFFQATLAPWSSWLTLVNSSPPGQNGRHFADDNLKCIFLNENDRIRIRISLKFVPRSPIDNKSALVQVMAWCRTGDKPLPEPLLTQFTDAYMRH